MMWFMYSLNLDAPPIPLLILQCRYTCDQIVHWLLEIGRSSLRVICAGILRCHHDYMMYLMSQARAEDTRTGLTSTSLKA